MDDCIIITIVVLLLVIGLLYVFLPRRTEDETDSETGNEGMVGGAAKKKKPAKKKPIKKTKKPEKKTKKNSFPTRASALTQIHHNSDARYIIIYIGDVYPRFTKESGLFKKAINQTDYKKEAYAAYERPLLGQWMDSVSFIKTTDDFEKKVRKEFHKELDNGARLVLIGKGYGAFFTKVLREALSDDVRVFKNIALNPWRLYELIPELIMTHLGLDSIRLGDIEFLSDRCMYEGVNWLPRLGISSVSYALLFYSEQVSNQDCYAFFGGAGSSVPDVVTFDTYYDNSYTVSYGKRFTTTEEWLRRAPMLNAALNTVL